MRNSLKEKRSRKNKIQTERGTETSETASKQLRARSKAQEGIQKFKLQVKAPIKLNAEELKRGDLASALCSGGWEAGGP